VLPYPQTEKRRNTSENPSFDYPINLYLSATSIMPSKELQEPEVDERPLADVKAVKKMETAAEEASRQAEEMKKMMESAIGSIQQANETANATLKQANATSSSVEEVRARNLTPES
jgi:hypothetical protein